MTTQNRQREICTRSNNRHSNLIQPIRTVGEKAAPLPAGRRGLAHDPIEPNGGEKIALLPAPRQPREQLAHDQKEPIRT